MQPSRPPSQTREDSEPRPWIGRGFYYSSFLCPFCVLLIFTVAKIYPIVNLEREFNGDSINESYKKKPVPVPKESSKEDEQTKPKDKDFFYKIMWPPLQHSLCGTGAPNLKLSSTLFELARTEAFENEDPRVAVLSNASTTKKNFFSGGYGADVFSGTNENGERFHTVYTRIWKCANNQIRSLLKEISEQFHEGGIREISLRKSLQEIKNNESDPSFPKVCIYTAIRDPISHFLSGYNEIETRLLGSWIKTNSWEGGKREIAPYHFRVPYNQTSPGLQRKRFRGFVEDLLLETPAFGHEVMYWHVSAMSRVLVDLKKYNYTLTGYIPQLQNLTSKLPAFMASTCPNFYSAETIPPVHIGGQHKSSGDPFGLYAAAKQVWKESGPFSRALCLLHAFDYACFENLPDGIPSLCRSVYQEHANQIVSVGKHNSKD